MTATMRTNGEVLLRAMMSGYPVEYRGYRYKLIKAGEDIVCPSGTYVHSADVLVNLTEMTGRNGTLEVVLPSHLTLNQILEMAIDMTEEERVGIISSQVLMSMNKQR